MPKIDSIEKKKLIDNIDKIIPKGEHRLKEFLLNSDFYPFIFQVNKSFKNFGQYLFQSMKEEGINIFIDINYPRNVEELCELLKNLHQDDKANWQVLFKKAIETAFAVLTGAKMVRSSISERGITVVSKRAEIALDFLDLVAVFQDSPEQAFRLVKEIPFYVFKRFFPFCEKPDFYTAILAELPLLGLLLTSEIPENGKLSLCMLTNNAQIDQIFSSVDTPLSILEIDTITYFTRHADRDSVLRLFEKMIEHSRMAAACFKILHDGFGPHIFSVAMTPIFLKNIVKIVSENVLSPLPEQETLIQAFKETLEEKLDLLVIPDVHSLNACIERESTTYKPACFLGRTLLYDSKKNSDRLAIKISKNEADQRELVCEYRMVQSLRHHKKFLGLNSDLPEPIALYRIPFSALQNSLRSYNLKFQVCADLITEQGECVLYKYRAPADYFTYLNDIADDQICERASLRSVRDLAILGVKCGLFYHQLAQFYHEIYSIAERSEEGSGRYVVLNGFLHRGTSLRNLRRNHGHSHQSSGELSGLNKGVLYPNVRASGLADLADAGSISNFKKLVGENWYCAVAQGGCGAALDFEKCGWGAKTNLAFILEFFAEYLFVHALLLGSRNLRLNRRNEADWIKTAELVHKLATEFIVQLTNHEDSAYREKIERYLQAIAPPDVLGLQMMFFIQGEYVRYLQSKRPFPDKIHRAETVVVDYRIEQKNYFWQFDQGISEHPQNGLDLGAYTSANPLTELLNLISSALVALVQERQKQISVAQAVETSKPQGALSVQTFLFFRHTNLSSTAENEVQTAEHQSNLSL